MWSVKTIRPEWSPRPTRKWLHSRPMPRSKMGSSSGYSASCSPGSSSTYRTIYSRPTISIGQIQSRHRHISWRNGITCRSTPSYAASPASSLGVIALAVSVMVLAFMPWLDTSRVRSANYRPLYRQFLFIFFGAVIGLGYLGAREPTGGYVIAARILTTYYFAFFFVILPLLGLFEKTKPVPNSISESV